MFELSDRPEPTTEPPERFPGGVDAIADEEKYGDIPDTPLIRDLDSVKNPAVDDKAPDELQEPEESQDEPTSDGASEPAKETQA
jgi:hypothetical protein